MIRESCDTYTRASTFVLSPSFETIFFVLTSVLLCPTSLSVCVNGGSAGAYFLNLQGIKKNQHECRATLVPYTGLDLSIISGRERIYQIFEFRLSTTMGR
jgi:hypothetical protein